MGEDQRRSHWAMEEIEKVDYLLDEIARAVEAHEVDRSVYDTLSPRYLRRREELVRILTGPVLPTPPPATMPTAEQVVEDVGEAAVPAFFDDGFTIAPSPVEKVRREPIAWSTWLAFTGALLVVIASAVFTAYTWDLLSPGLKLAALGGVTALFYALGEYVRAKLRLEVGGVALIATGSAMLLFDGWTAIRGFRIESPWAWPLVLLACAVVWSATELRVSRRWFGAIGVAAQVGWWWLAGDALGLEPVARVSVIAVVALAWSAVSSRPVTGSGVASLASILDRAAPLVAGAALLGGIALAASGSATALACSVITGAAASIVLERSGPRGLSAVAAGPVLVASMAHVAAEGPTWWLVPILAAVAGVAVWQELRAATKAHAAVFVAAGLLVLWDVARLLGDDPRILVALVALSAVSLLVFHRWVDARRAAGTLPVGLVSLAEVAEVAGWLLLAIATYFAVMMRLTSFPGLVESGARDTALTVWLFAAWVLGTLSRRNPITPIVVEVGSAIVALDAVTFFAPAVAQETLATIVIVISWAWSRARDVLARHLGADPEVLGGLGLAGSLVGLLSIGLLLDAALPPSWPSVVAVAACASVWTAEHRRAEPFGLPVAAALWVGVGWAAWWAGPGSHLAPLAASVAAVLVSAASLAPALRVRLVGWAASAAAVASVACVQAFDRPAVLAGALASTTVAWVVTAYVSANTDVVYLAAVALVGAVMAALSALDAPPWAAVAASVVLGGAGVAPTFVLRSMQQDGDRGSAARLATVLGASGLVQLASFTALAFVSATTGATEGGWADFSSVHLAALFFAFGALTLGWTAIVREEWGVYVGTGAWLAALFAGLEAAEVTRVEWYSAPAAVWLASQGYLYVWRDRARLQPMALDVAAVGVLIAPSAVLSLAGYEAQHGLWTLGFALAAVASGVVLRTRVYFFGGIFTLVAEALWLSRGYLRELPWWVYIGGIGLSLLVAAILHERRRSLPTSGLRGVADALNDWR